MCVAQRDACASRKDERASRETGENTRVRWAEASARGEQLGRGATRPWGARQDGRRGCSTSGDACASRNDERASQDKGEITRVRVAAASARGEQLGHGATRPWGAQQDGRRGSAGRPVRSFGAIADSRSSWPLRRGGGGSRAWHRVVRTLAAARGPSSSTAAVGPSPFGLAGARVALYAVLEPLQIREAVGPSGAAAAGASRGG